MEGAALQKLIGGGETSRVQFKENITNPLSAAQELIAFANTAVLYFRRLVCRNRYYRR